ncbi:hypothetical protein [Novipirellula artificiosorum]|nr:hypothetical protein [Novipirellula artificiosorum]
MKPICFLLVLASFVPFAQATTTWDGRHSTDKIEVTVVYFVPSDRQPLPDWRDRVDYYCRRIELFHQREFGSQSLMKTIALAEPFFSEHTTEQLRAGDANSIFFQTLREADRRLEFAKDESKAFRILLVLSDINWRPLDDFYRLHPKQDGTLEFEGNLNQGQHFPGAASGGARATYLANRGVGWGLVSGDGWRVPYRGCDCVIYHEGCGHTVGLPHPEPGNGSVMSLGQYNGWLSESWLDKDQKSRMQWHPEPIAATPQLELFTRFRALPDPMVPAPDQDVNLRLDWPDGVHVDSLRVRLQTAINGAWIERPQQWADDAPKLASLGRFDRPTPVSYRVDATLAGGERVELWGYFQVRNDPAHNPQPIALSQDLVVPVGKATAPPSRSTVLRSTQPGNVFDLLDRLDPIQCWQVGQWTHQDGKLESSKAYGVRIELPYTPPEEYRMTLIVEPLDPPTGLILGQRSGDRRFLTLLGFGKQENTMSAIENVAGRNVGNETTWTGAVLQQGRLSQIIVTVRKNGVRVQIDGGQIIDWQGKRDDLSLDDYWSTPDRSKLFLGAYDCRYRFHRLDVEPL